MDKKHFIITIDTEGDNAWNKPSEITTHNARYLHRFQELCERYQMKPVYLTNYEMCESPVFQELGREALKKNTAEIGAHLHAWYSPPAYQLTANDYACLPYLIEYPQQVMAEKLTYLTNRLQEVFDTKMVSHRAGRWAFNETYARELVKLGYRVDCSVTPYVSWKHMMGDPAGKGGTDYRLFPSHAYQMDLDNLRIAGHSDLLQVPVTIRPHSRRYIYTTAIKKLFGPGVVVDLLNKVFPFPGETDLAWLRPIRGNIKNLLWLLKTATANEGVDYVEFMIHSSEFMPGGSPYFKTEEDVEGLYSDLETLFSAAQANYKGTTLKEYADYYKAMR